VNAEPRITWYRVEAENMESIHNHAAYALIEKDRRGEVKKASGKKPKAQAKAKR